MLSTRAKESASVKRDNSTSPDTTNLHPGVALVERKTRGVFDCPVCRHFR